MSQDPSNPSPPVKLTLEEQIVSRLAQLSTEELAMLGRPHGQPARFLYLKDGYFVYEVMSKRVPLHHARAARQMLDFGPKAGESNDEFNARIAKEFAQMRTTQMQVTRAAVAKFASGRIVNQLMEDAKARQDEAKEIEEKDLAAVADSNLNPSSRMEQSGSSSDS